MHHSTLASDVRQGLFQVQLVRYSGGTLGAIISASRNGDFLFLSDKSLRGPLMNNSLSTGSDTRSSTPALSASISTRAKNSASCTLQAASCIQRLRSRPWQPRQIDSKYIAPSS